VRTLAHFSVTVEPHGEARLVRVSGDLDLSTADRLRSALDAARADGVTTLVDLSAVNFIDSAGLKVLLRSTQAADADHWTWCIVRASSAVWRLAEVSGTTSQLPLGAPPENPERLSTFRSTARALAGGSAPD
jgi:anti-sigma B factor antagonist